MIELLAEWQLFLAEQFITLALMVAPSGHPATAIISRHAGDMLDALDEEEAEPLG